MATTDQHFAADADAPVSDATPAGTGHQQSGFGVEYRQQARQRRFRRSTDAAPHNAIAAPESRRAGLAPGRAPIPESAARGERLLPPPGRERLSDNSLAMVTEMSRMADRVIEAREALAAERGRANRAERDLASGNDRIMAARALVHEAQRTAHVAAERCAFVEGRCEALQEALDMAINASLMQRWRWRRRAASRDH